MTEKRKLLPLIIIVFLVLVLPIALLLVRQRQEIRKKAFDFGMLSVVNSTVSNDQVFDIFVQIPIGENVGYAKGALNFNKDHWQSVEFSDLFGIQNVANGVKFASSNDLTNGKVNFTVGAKSNSQYLTGVFYKISLKPKTNYVGATTISLSGNYIKAVSGNPVLGNLTGSTSITITSPTTTTPTATATPTVIVTPAPNSAIISIGNPTKLNNKLTFPINVNSAVNVYEVKMSLYYGSGLSNPSVSSGVFGTVMADNKAGYVTFDSKDNSKINKSGLFANVTFDLATGTNTASVWLLKGDIPNFIYVTKAAYDKLSVSCLPSTDSSQCKATYTATTTTPTPTATATATPTPTPTATPIITPTPTPTSTPGTPTTLLISNIAAAVGGAAKTTPNVRISFDTNINTTASLVIKLPNGDIYGPVSPTPNLDYLGFPSTPANRNYLTSVVNNVDNFKHTAPSTQHIFDMGSLINGRYYYKVWASAGSQTLSGPTSPNNYGTFEINTAPTPTIPAGGVPGDTNGNGCVGGRDLTYVDGHYQTSTQCTLSSAPITPTGASNGDFNHDGCVDDLDLAIVGAAYRRACNDWQ